MNLIEEIKAFPDSASHLSPYAKEKLLELKKKIIPVLAHLQNHPQFNKISSEKETWQDSYIEYCRRDREWKEELDKRVGDVEPMVYIKRKQLQDYLKYSPHATDSPYNRLLKELLGDAPKPCKELKK